MSRRLLLPCVLAGAVLLAACVPVTPPPPPPPPPPQPVSQYCAPTTPSSAATYKAAFDALRKTYTEWATADGAVPVHLPGGRTLWMFGDTYVGKVSSTGVVESGARLVSNSAVLQTGRCFRPVMGGAPLSRTAWIPGPGANQGYWPSSAVVDTAKDRISVLLMQVVYRPDALVDVVGMRVARFRASTLEPLSMSGVLDGTSEERPYGSTAFWDETFAYLYSTHEGQLHVARAPVGSVHQQSTWQYWVGPEDVWSAPGNHAAAQPMDFGTTIEDLTTLDFGAPIAPLRVAPYGEGYLGTAMLVDGFIPRPLAFTAPSPFGPWTYVQDLGTTPTNVRSYGAQTLFGLQGGAPPLLSYSTNLLPGQTTTTISRYGFRFANPLLPPAPTAISEVPDTTPSTAPPTSTSTTTTSTSTTTTSTSTTTTTTAPPPP